MLRAAATAAAILVLGGCSSARPGQTAPTTNPNLITRAEIGQAGVSSAYDLIRKLRPLWLIKRGEGSFFHQSDVVVYVDGTKMTGGGTLRETLGQITSANIDNLQFLDARQATLRFGSGHVHGAILIQTLR